MEQIKERNKPLLPKQDQPKTPFFLFDLDKVMAGDVKALPDGILKQTFFSEATTKKDERFDKKLKSLLDGEAKAKDVIDYLKSLSPSGVELEFISLGSFEFGTDPAESVGKMLKVFESAVKTSSDFDFVQAMLNNFLKNHQEIIVNEEKLSEILERI